MDLAEGKMNPDDKQHWENHLQTCSACAEKLEAWTSLINSITNTRLVAAPAEVISAGKQIFRITKTIEPRRSLRQVVASIVFDSLSQAATAGVRAELATLAEQNAMRHVVFQAEEYDIYVRLSMVGDHRDLLGQILRRDSSVFTTETNLHLRHDDQRIASAAV